MLAIVAAMRRELSAIERSLSVKSRIKIEGLDLIEGSLAEEELVLATVGIGGVRPREMVTLLREKCHPDALVCVGYASGASSECKVGDLVLYTEIRYQDKTGTHEIEPPTSSPLKCDEKLVKRANKALTDAELPYHQGPGATVPRMIDSPRAKRQLGEQLKVQAIDMESYQVVEAARIFDLPVLVVRAITDTVEQRLPDMTSILNPTGQASFLRVLSYVATHPLDIYPMIRLARSSSIANRNLARFVASFVQTEESNA